MKTMNRTASDMIHVHAIPYKGQHIDAWRGKYSNKGDRLFTIGNVQFDTIDEAKAHLDEMYDETFKSGRGGAREGAGRPKAENPKVRVSYRLAPDVVEWLRACPEGATAAIETLVRNERERQN